MRKTHLDGKSKDLVAENISKLEEIFPGIFAEGKINFDKLKDELGVHVEDSREKYNFTWPGKTKAIKESQKLSTGTLRPSEEKSEDWK